ncbi:MAG: hypothetical protein M3M96_05165 [Candidatus Eremiobacteraeota bacterium]|nr:hypothetical protein [Candidatus Eremiobacteraeota bacterium]
MNTTGRLRVALLATTIAIGSLGVAPVQSAPFVPNAMQQNHLRGERGSARNLLRISKQLERDIDQMQHDRHDYGGHREAAIDALQKARQAIEDAIEYDRSHPNQ